MSDFATLLRQHRTAKGLSQERLAAGADMDHSLISRMERGGMWSEGGRRPNPGSIKALASALGLNDDERDELYLTAGFIPPGIDAKQLGRWIALVRRANTLAPSAA